MRRRRARMASALLAVGLLAACAEPSPAARSPAPDPTPREGQWEAERDGGPATLFDEFAGPLGFYQVLIRDTPRAP